MIHLKASPFLIHRNRTYRCAIILTYHKVKVLTLSAISSRQYILSYHFFKKIARKTQKRISSRIAGDISVSGIVLNTTICAQVRYILTCQPCNYYLLPVNGGYSKPPCGGRWQPERTKGERCG